MRGSELASVNDKQKVRFRIRLLAARPLMVIIGLFGTALRSSALPTKPDISGGMSAFRWKTSALPQKADSGIRPGSGSPLSPIR